MQRSRWLWRTIALCGVAFTALFVFGFAYAVKTVMLPEGAAPPAARAPETPMAGADGALKIAALGDSLTYGFGDSTGQGYVGRVRSLLEEHADVPVHVAGNFAQNGYTTDRILEDVKEREGIAAALAIADVVVLTAGGNDLFSVGDEIDASSFVSGIPETQEELRELLAAVRGAAPEAHVYYIGLYNPFIAYDEFAGTTEAVQAWNMAAFETIESFEAMTFVPTFDLFENGTERKLASDRYHPNDEGYARIAERLAALIE
ncbi:GDSL-type esterase/lipase family protein [Paenibacillus sp.]|uniref:GDSL-type esterase/lipase family protein n=1 Tax=Paenibacillus sp. TaxID=58172 RepID=UPI002D72E3EC|nr:GDSL-type esterase/lipase family protein [Paenibacillus sp.]HZG85327.1 GDSL-type esterase/lipase family protein [Paenibacillus sp.]